jgi:catechol 2,3-dioxygenase-like lactoylglutathione lyase family enzyme
MRDHSYEATMKRSGAGQEGESASQLISQRIAELGDWRGETLGRIRALIKEADPDVLEQWKWMGTPVEITDNLADHATRYWHSNIRPYAPGDMTIQRMDNVLIVVDDLEAAKAFFAELGMELEGETTVEGRWVDRVVGLNDVRSDIAMMRTPDGHSRVELTKFHTPPAVRAEPEGAPANALGIRRIMFAVDDIDDVVARLRRHGAELVGEIAQYKDIYRLCFLRGPEGIIIGLAEQLG